MRTTDYRLALQRSPGNARRGSLLSATAGISILVAATAALAADEVRHFEPRDVFDLEYAIEPQISPDGTQVAYVRRSMDIMADRMHDTIWVVDADGSNHRPVTSGLRDYSSPRWSPSGDRLAYVTGAGGRGAEIFVRWMDTGQTALATNLPHKPGSLTWSPDGTQLAFEMFVADSGLELASMPKKPEGADWAPPVRVVDQMPYRLDGVGYLESGYHHLFVVPSEGGSARRLTSGDYEHRGPLSFTPDGSALIFAANRIDRVIDDPVESELWRVDLSSGELTALTSRDGPDFAPAVSPRGRYIAYAGFDDKKRGSQNAKLYLLDLRNGESRTIETGLDRGIQQLAWAGDRQSLHIAYDDRGMRVLAEVGLDGRVTELADDLGSAIPGRPYTSGMFSVARNGVVAYTRGSPTAPAEVGVVNRAGRARTLTQLNDDLLAHRDLGSVERITWRSSAADLEIEGWLVTPPAFDAEQKYPLLLEIHGGPFAAYGPHFSPEIQLYAAAGYVVLYANPRGSSSYGQAFMDEIHHAYPGRDYDDLMSGVDAVMARGFVDEDRLYVTGGSGGGVLTAWIIGKTDRFRAAVVQKPVINWASFVLTSDGTGFFARYWFEALPWENPEAYWRRSPLSLVGNVETPTMLITGEEDWRTPMAESEQYYQALQLRGIDTALVRVPERSHNLVARPSHLVAKALNILGWFERYR